MNKERPILFSGPMVQAILDGRKTQTRRVISNVPETAVDVTHNNAKDIWFWVREHSHLDGEIINRYGKPGDRLWVRETFQPLWTDENKFNDERDYKTGHGYYVNYPATDGIAEWHDFYCEEMSNACKPSIFMPRWASRITLEITGVRVERLQDISETDAFQEGVEKDHYGQLTVIPESIVSKGIFPNVCYRYVFGVAWEKINGKKHPWASNPWVWVVEFKKIGDVCQRTDKQ